MVVVGLIKMLRNRYIMYGVDSSKLASLLCTLLEKKRFADCAESVIYKTTKKLRMTSP
jgi:hypothetical protein